MGMVILAAGECLISAACCRRRTCWRWKWHHCKCCFAMEGYCCRAALSCIEWLSLVLHSLISLALLGLACACYFYGDAFSSVIDSAAGKVPCDTDAAEPVDLAKEDAAEPATSGDAPASAALRAPQLLKTPSNTRGTTQIERFG